MISVIIPCYNHGTALPACLDSLREQSIDDFEVIIVDDGSSDDTPSIVKKYIDTYINDLQIKYLKIDHRGAPTARNYGAQEARGEYLLFADADLIFHKDALRKLLSALQRNPNASYAYSSFRFGWKKFNSQPFNAAALRKDNYIHTSALIRREHFLGFDKNLKRFQDWDLWLTMLKNGFTGIFVPEVLFRARITRVGISAWRPRLWYVFWSFPYQWVGLAPRLFIQYILAKKMVQQKHSLT
ncbi:hypothetical protein A3H10_04080 [Candidatus Uhrbacteria bacterium RIFCSPLOWO2_12_FULL_46_10]|uniref:Glycosyltransferase 2-like domain-containing protein n=1 Tax=Candidatus Uhrbacteria bacterium RIFCSPLOWO2_01_FULL_47_25 TaxID=1802402 RepID=A0A1F7UZH5_9BACT|nr:MAG: hypothetical protein A2752_01695 [Candidatus Uhrbacteria bacterium RIFCSPHIGHO2_01_FULL_46_23]OGL70657.1 MAG: hypothetical protein A3D60_04320 [Candidatus Uhrbacteria bacterium RIFCSPHIGHO2_02_FULL_47_29]OGL76423.1 MAG: hypothetical protein A3E96_02340 [Candidatus Uhrbacteria bacterium RIFCSPHIGHO2_12_FULL_46_13]OGL83164.1 MAG: hypothetical protein A2936_01540 [Candidatus Uhrbacteria bacterium RIFCSPLOWO2_01_FULL_47_25]OGL84072.1 MAG: hypothetical protein A3I37_01845 [Candidatus Uhrbact